MKRSGVLGPMDNERARSVADPGNSLRAESKTGRPVSTVSKRKSTVRFTASRPVPYVRIYARVSDKFPDSFSLKVSAVLLRYRTLFNYSLSLRIIPILSTICLHPNLIDFLVRHLLSYILGVMLTHTLILSGT